jgi:hypothetical protein
MSSPQDQFTELTHRTQENFKNLWQQWSERSTELLKGIGGRARPVAGDTPGNPEEVLDAVFDFAENLIAQQRAFAKQMLKAASKGQETVTDASATTSGSPLSSVPSTPGVSPATPETSAALPDAKQGR